MSVSEKTKIDQLLTFKLDNEYYGVDVTQVQEVLGFQEITKIPQMPPYMRGVINVRDTVVPVIDLRVKFGLGEKAVTVDTSIVVLEIAKGDETIVLGVLVDSVDQVVELDPTKIEPPPKIGTKIKSQFISGMGRWNENFIIILNINYTFTSDELAVARQAETGQADKGKKKGKGVKS